MKIKRLKKESFSRERAEFFVEKFLSGEIKPEVFFGFVERRFYEKRKKFRKLVGPFRSFVYQAFLRRLPQKYEVAKDILKDNIRYGLLRKQVKGWGWKKGTLRETDGMTFLRDPEKNKWALLQVIVSYARHRYSRWDILIEERRYYGDPITLEDKIQETVKGLKGLQEKEPEVFEVLKELAEELGEEGLEKELGRGNLDPWTVEAVKKVLK